MKTSNGDEWRPQGHCVGWLDGEELLLEPESVYAQVQTLAREQGESIPIASRMLWKRLKERKFLSSWEEKRTTVRRSLAGVEKRPVLNLSPAALCT